MLYLTFWLVLTSNVLLLEASLSNDEDRSVSCDCTPAHRTCSLYLSKITSEEINQLSTEISRCFNDYTQQQHEPQTNLSEEKDLHDSLKCLVKDIRYNLGKIEEDTGNSTVFSEIFRAIEMDLISNKKKENVDEYKCFYCVFAQLSIILNSTHQIVFGSTPNPTIEDVKPDERQVEGFLTLLVFLQQLQNTSVDKDHFVNRFLDIDKWTIFLNSLTINKIDVERIKNNVERITNEKHYSMYEKGTVKNCGFESECPYRPILFLLYIIALAGNGLLILIFIRHREMRSDRNTIILNLAIGDVLSILFNVSIQILFITGEPFKKLKIYYRVIDLSFEVTTSVCIYTIVALSVQRYLAVVPDNRFSRFGFSKHMNSVRFICLLWILACVPQIIDVSTNMTIEEWAMRNFILYCILPIVIIATFYMMTSWKLRKSAQTMPGEVIRQEKARTARVRSSNVLLALIVVFVTSYTPIQLFRFIEIWYYGGGYLFDYVDVFAYSILSLNSCFNPVALYVASATFRRYFNRYFLCGQGKKDLDMSRSDSKTSTKQSTSRSMITHV